MSNFKLTYSNSVYLDVIRAVSSQMVVVGHAISFLAILPMFQPPHFPYIQNIAVLIFFILSGFLISYSIFRKDDYSFKEYFIDRFSRIYSGLIPSILVVFILDYINIKLNPVEYAYYDAFNIKTFLGNLLMLEDFPGQILLTENPITSFGSGRTLWSLAVEWWLYMAFGYFIIKIWRTKKFRFQTVLVFLLLAIAPCYNVMYGRGNSLTTYWLLGVLLYILLPILKAANLPRKISGFLFLLFSTLAIGREALIIIKDFKYIAYDPVFAVLLMLILLFSIDFFKDLNYKDGFVKVIRFFADYSFTLYLVHYSVLVFIFSNFKAEESPYLYFLISLLLSNVLSAGIAYFTEMKHRTVRNKLKEIFLKKTTNDLR